MSLKPFVTVIMPVFNCEQYVQEAVTSIINQSFTNFEFLIIDDASTDGTVQLIKKFNDPRIKLIEKPLNTGLTKSLNYGLSIAKGTYIARMDGDDISYPRRFEKQIAFLESHPEVVLCGTNYTILGTNIDKNVPNLHEDIKVGLLEGSCIGHPTVMIRKSTLDQNGITYNFEEEPAEDFNLWIRLLKFGKLYNLPEVLLAYRVHEHQVSKERRDSQQYKGVNSKLLLLNYLEFSYDNDEQEILRKILSRKVKIQPLNFDQLLFFVDQTIDKLIESNRTGFFEKDKFKHFLDELVRKIIQDYFLYRARYSPRIFGQYLKIRYKCNFKFNFLTEFKLFIKSLSFFNNNYAIKR